MIKVTDIRTTTMQPGFHQTPVLFVLEAFFCSMLLGFFFAACFGWCFGNRRTHIGVVLAPPEPNVVVIEEPTEPSTRNLIREYNWIPARQLRDEMQR